MGGLGIRLMLKCVDKIGYEMQGSKIVLTKFKRALPKEEALQKKLTGEEEIYKRTLWEEMKLLEPEGERQPAQKQTAAPEEEQEMPLTLPQADDRPLERLYRFHNRLSSLFPIEVEEELRTPRFREAEKPQQTTPKKPEMPKTEKGKLLGKHSEETEVTPLDLIRLENELHAGAEEASLVEPPRDVSCTSTFLSPMKFSLTLSRRPIYTIGVLVSRTTFLPAKRSSSASVPHACALFPPPRPRSLSATAISLQYQIQQPPFYQKLPGYRNGFCASLRRSICHCGMAVLCQAVIRK
jgi:hypothetical protein